MRIVDFVPASGVVRLSGGDGHAVVRELAGALARVGGLDGDELAKLLWHREHISSTAIGHEVAIPHARLDVAAPVGMLGLAPDGVDFGAPDGLPVRLFVALVSAPRCARQLVTMAAVARELSDHTLRDRLLAAPDDAAVYALLETVVRPWRERA